MPVTIPARRRLAVVEPVGGEGVQLEEGRARVDEPVDALARQQLAAGAVPLDRFSPPPRATAAVRSRSSATSSSIRPRGAANAASRATVDSSTATAASLPPGLSRPLRQCELRKDAHDAVDDGAFEGLGKLGGVLPTSLSHGIR